jgi:hypothetical protein
MLNDRIANVIIGVVTAIWAINFLARFVVADYEPSETINAIFMAIVGGVFALKGRNSGGNGNGKQPREGSDK